MSKQNAFPVKLARSAGSCSSAMALGLIAVLVAGCGSKDYSKTVETARKHLQLSQNDKALAALSLTDDSDVPAEYHYLKAITLDRLNRNEPAKAEIDRAIEKAPDNPKYKGLSLRFRLFARDRSSVDQLIELNRKFASTSAVSLFATYGFHAKAMLLESEKKPEAAKYHNQRKMTTLANALTLSAEMPELHPELLNFAVLYQKSDQALELIDELLLLDPESVNLKQKKIRVLLQLKQPDEAIKIAQQLYSNQKTNRKAAESFAIVLSQGTENDQHDEWFDDLVERFPQNTMVMSKYAVYLTRTGRMASAHTLLDLGISKSRRAEDKEALAFIAITLPLEIGSPQITDIKLRQYKSLLKDDLLVEYFYARIMFLEKRYSEAVQKMLSIVEASRNRKDGSRVLATEALVWIRRILADKVLKQQMEAVLGATQKQNRKFEVKVATEEQIKKAQEARQARIDAQKRDGESNREADKKPEPDQSSANKKKDNPRANEKTEAKKEASKQPARSE